MNRVLLSSSFVLALACLATSDAFAEQNHEKWLEFFEGRWTYERPDVGLSGSATYTRHSDCSALLVEFKLSDGTAGIELLGWDSARGILAATGYGSEDGVSWRFEANKVSGNALRGTHQGVLPDGTPFESKFTLERKDDNHYEWKSIGKAKSGDTVEMSASFRRVTD
jgi:hypothetical protein